MRTSTIPFRTRRVLVLGALAAAVVLGVVPSAQAANLVPNSGFETNCSGIPCNWSPTVAGITLARDTTNPHSGSASLKVTETDTNFNGAISDCVVGAFQAGSHSAFYWYRTTDAKVGEIEMNNALFTSSNCSGVPSGASNGPLTTTATNDGLWHQVSGNLNNALTTIQSVKVDIFFQCEPCSGNPVSAIVNFDDVSLDSSPLAITLASFRAGRSQKGVLVRWRTGTEAETLGFNVYRQQGARRIRLNRRVLPAVGAVAGSSYSFLDRLAPRHRVLRYWLQDVDLTGARTWHGPVRVASS